MQKVEPRPASKKKFRLWLNFSNPPPTVTPLRNDTARLFPLFWLVGMDDSMAAQIHRRVYTDNHGNGFGRVEESCI